MSDFEDLAGHDDCVVFSCLESIERLSVRNAKYEKNGRFEGRNNTMPSAITQNALVKFVQFAPSSLRWFRSDLTQENIEMLQEERPEIEFLN